MAYVIVREPDRVPFLYELGAAALTIGREPDNDLVIGDAHASRRHARLERVEERVRVVDLGSSHGTLVNGRPIADGVLSDGDVVQIGKVLLSFHERVYPLGAAPLTRPAAGGASPDGRRLQVIRDFGQAVASGLGPAALAERVLDATLCALDCERGVVGLMDGASLAGRKVARSRRPGDRDDVVVSRSLLEAMISRREAVLLRDPSAAPTLVRDGVRSAMGAPLVSSGRGLGFIYVDDRARAEPFSPEELDFLTALAALAAAALDRAETEQRTHAVAEALRSELPTVELAGDSEPMRALRHRLARYAPSPSPVLVRGESGTGKELVARTLHALSPRAAGPFVAVNCAAIPETLIEAELFGHEKGAFTGAVRSRRGKFLLAHGGTLFLDEIGDLSLAGQAKILRVLEERVVEPLGSDEIIPVDVRVISATHKPLDDEIAAGRFRQDLFYRLNVADVEVPPLRARGEDVVLLAALFARTLGQAMGRRGVSFSDAALAALRRYGWPGNVRQLRNEIERALLLAEGNVLGLEELRARVDRLSPPPSDGRPLTFAERFNQLEVSERALVMEALGAAEGNVSEAARLLGISRIMLRRRLERFGLDAA